MTRLVHTIRGGAVSAYLFARGVLFAGRRHRCPCCGWRVRSFVAGGGSLRRRPRGYCPRCNSKARHRRVWLHLQHHGELLEGSVSLLHVAPHRSLSRALWRTAGVRYHAVGLHAAAGVDTVGSLTALPFADGAFDRVVAVHVLEHVDDDRAGMREIARVLRWDGWAVVNVPCRLDADTYEDASITTPAARRLAFGEDDHRRVYGRDLVDRLEEAGFTVEIDRADDIEAGEIERFGLTQDEHVFRCRVGTGGRP